MGDLGVGMLLLCLDMVALGMIAGAIEEPTLLALCTWHRLRSFVTSYHWTWTSVVDGLGSGRCIACVFTAISTGAEWLLILDLIWARIFHVVCPATRSQQSAILLGESRRSQTLAILIHGLDSDVRFPFQPFCRLIDLLRVRSLAHLTA